MLSLVLALGLAVFFTVEIVRKLPGVKKWHLDGVKPFACDQCMSFWTALTWSVPIAIWGDLTWLQLVISGSGAAGVALCLLLWTDSLEPSNPPNFPNLPE